MFNTRSDAETFLLEDLLVYLLLSLLNVAFDWLVNLAQIGRNLPVHPYHFGWLQIGFAVFCAVQFLRTLSRLRYYRHGWVWDWLPWRRTV